MHHEYFPPQISHANMIEPFVSILSEFPIKKLGPAALLYIDGQWERQRYFTSKAAFGAMWVCHGADGQYRSGRQSRASVPFRPQVTTTEPFK